jgi:glycosyltransferase involved in cell wall biosynthesis
MKILYIDNEPISDHTYLSEQSRSYFPFYLNKKINLKSVGKPDWIRFYSIYSKFKPDLIIVEWIPASIIPLFLRRLGIINCPITLNWGDYYAEMMDNSLKHPKFITRWMEDYTVRNVDFITTVSRRNEKIAKKRGKQVFYIPHGIFDTNKKTKVRLEKLKTRKGNTIAIYLGDQSKWKKVDQLIEAVKGLPCDLFMFGETNPEFQKIASKNVHFMGWIDRLEVKSLLEQADILINTGDQDCNYKLFEYINARKVILAYDGLTNNILTHGENAFLAKNFKTGLIELIKNKKLREKISRNIKKYKTYTWEEIIEMYLKVYKKMLHELKHQDKFKRTW